MSFRLRKIHLKMKSLFTFIVASFLFPLEILAQNLFLPPWEYIPDGESHVFGNRVYIYGSHGKAGSKTFCYTKHVVWSAALNYLTNISPNVVPLVISVIAQNIAKSENL
jgi:hypothetical protein